MRIQASKRRERDAPFVLVADLPLLLLCIEYSESMETIRGIVRAVRIFIYGRPAINGIEYPWL